MREKHTGQAGQADADYEGLSPAPRRRAREAALLMLYQLDFGGNDAAAAEHTLQSLALDEESAAFARQLVQNACLFEHEADGLIAVHSREWEFERLFNIDVTILRLALCELKSATPANIVINEAVELAKKFGDEASPAFINAVLDTVFQKQPGEST